MRLPTSPARLAVKRVVGLPGELISIRDGDVYVNGTIVRKRLRQQRRMSVLVHDDRARPRGHSSVLRRWRPADSDRWQDQAGTFRYSAPPTRDSGPLDAPAPSARLARNQLDWLVYHHQPCLPPPWPRGHESPVTDDCGYNQGVSRRLFDVTDLTLSCLVRVSGPGVLAVLAHNGRETLEVQWSPNQRRLRLFRGGCQAAEAQLPATWDDRKVSMEVMMCDRQLQLALDGHVYLAYAYLPQNLPLRFQACPLAIGAAGLTAQVGRLCVWRDVYYTHPDAVPGDWSLEKPLAANQYLLLGDNSPVSIDGRHAAADGRVLRTAIVGRVLPQP